jgi:hypothetical protein
VSEAFVGRRAMLRLEGLSSIERRLARLAAEKIGRTADMQYKKLHQISITTRRFWLIQLMHDKFHVDRQSLEQEFPIGF